MGEYPLEKEFAKVLKIASRNLRVVECRSPSEAHHLDTFMSSARAPSIGGELVGSFDKEDTFVKPNDGISPVIILLNVRAFPFAFVVTVTNETFPIGELDGSKSSNRIICLLYTSPSPRDS